MTKAALGIDIRSGEGLVTVNKVLDNISDFSSHYEILFLDCDDSVLIKRYKETRRQHPLSMGGRVEDGIKNERKKMKFLKDKADYIIDTSQMLVRDLKGEVDKIFVKDEPGGGPFLTYNQDGTVSLQILESSQIDKTNEEYQKMFTEGTHFNPVDLVCAVKDYKGQPFNLPDFVDKSTGFISSKSKNGKELKALELPGLWNGAMSDWNTVFVEVPLATFNPVKTVNDLLREQHQ